MDLTQLANLGEFIGGVAVLVTLIYLALQVRHGNETARSETVRAFVADWNEQVLAPLADPATGPLLRRANTNFQNLDGDEQIQAHGVWTQMVFLGQELYELDTQGRVSDPLRAIGIGSIASYLQAPGTAQWWESCQVYFDPDYRRALQEAMQTAPPIQQALPHFVAFESVARGEAL